MVQFLLQNSLGAWWVSRHLGKPCPVDLTYLRRTEDGTPAAGSFEGWPNNLSEFRLLDPCCGSGHFLVAAFLMLVPMRMALEGTGAPEAVNAVLRENIHGLEVDQRCVAIAAFALALEAWRYPDTGSFRTLPKLNVAWCGQPVSGSRDQWLLLAGGHSRLEAGMSALFDTFRDAPILGSLIDPTRTVPTDIFTAGFQELGPLLDLALREHGGEEEWEESALVARGITEACRLLSSQYQLVVTNVPYLVRSKQAQRLRSFVDHSYSDSGADLATVFLERIALLCAPGGAHATVTPQNWLSLKSYQRFRKSLIRSQTLNHVCRVGSGATATASWDVLRTLAIVTNATPRNESVVTDLKHLNR